MATTKTQSKKTAAEAPAPEPKPEKFRPVKADEIAWAPAESGEGLSAIARRFELDVHELIDDEGS